MKGDVFKFLCGAATAGAVGHAGYALAVTTDIISVPIWRGREWGVGNLMIEAAVWAVLAIAFGYLSWGRSVALETPVSPTATPR